MVYRIVLQDINTDTISKYLKEPPDLRLIPSWGVPLQIGFLPLDIRSDLLTRSRPLVSAECSSHPREGIFSPHLPGPKSNYFLKNFPSIVLTTASGDEECPRCMTSGLPSHLSLGASQLVLLPGYSTPPLSPPLNQSYHHPACCGGSCSELRPNRSFPKMRTSTSFLRFIEVWIFQHILDHAILSAAMRQERGEWILFSIIKC